MYRQIEYDDIPALSLIRAAEWGTAEFWVDRLTRYLEVTHNPMQSLAPRVIYLALNENSPIGFIAGHLTRRYDCDGELQWISVHKEHRGQGIASQLFHMLAGWFAEQQAASVCVNCDTGNERTFRFYTRHGAVPLNQHWLMWYDVRPHAFATPDPQTFVHNRVIWNDIDQELPMDREHALTAILPSNNLDASEAFYKRLGFTRPAEERSANPAEDTYRILSDGKGGHLHLTNAVEGWLVPGHNPFGLYLYADNVDELAERFPCDILGRNPVPEDKPWGMYEFALSDPDGTLVRIGWPTRLRTNQSA